MVAALLVALLVQDTVPRVDAMVDRDRVQVGEEITYTITAESRSVVPMEITLAPVSGLEIVARSERSEVSTVLIPIRRTTVEVRLRALRPGEWRIAPATVRQGDAEVRSNAITIEVIGGGSGATALTPRVQRMVRNARPPRDGSVQVSVLLSDRTVRVGEQVDVVTAAWFPRDLRVQLRRPPVLQPPTFDGVWSYPQPVPPGIATSREVNGRWYDLFVVHQVLFPLLPGTVRTTGATLRYSVPLALQFFSQEERFSRTSGPVVLNVLPLPAAGRPADFATAVGRGLTVQRSAAPASVTAGEAVTVEYVVEGLGNVTLWPEPTLAWPEALRAYPAEVSEVVEMHEGLLGGRKTFRYLVVADSVGTFALPAVTYPYFDLARGRYLAARVPAGRLTAAPAGEAATARIAPPPLLTADSPAWPRRLMEAVPAWLWALIVFAPPLAWYQRVRRPVARRRRAAPPPDAPTLRSAERRLDGVLQALVPDAEVRAGDGLAAALRAAGVEPSLVARTLAVRGQLLGQRYGPERSSSAATDLAQEVHDLAHELGDAVRARRRRAPLRALGVVLAAAVGATAVQATLAAQAPGPIELYRAGSLRAAAEGFARSAAAEPANAAHWYNLGATWYRLGSDSRAHVAWLRALRLAPRNATVREALRLTPPPTRASAQRIWVSPLTADELVFLGAITWLVGWGVLVVRPGRRRVGGALLLVALVCGAAALALDRWYARPVALLAEPAELRRSPHGRAETVTRLESGTVLEPVRRDGGWVLVEASEDRRGWLPADLVLSIPG